MSSVLRFRKGGSWLTISWPGCSVRGVEDVDSDVVGVEVGVVFADEDEVVGRVGAVVPVSEDVLGVATEEFCWGELVWGCVEDFCEAGFAGECVEFGGELVFGVGVVGDDVEWFHRPVVSSTVCFVSFVVGEDADGSVDVRVEC